MKVQVSKTMCIAEVSYEGLQGTWLLPPRFSPEGKLVTKPAKDFCQILTTDHNQEKALSGCSPTLSCQLTLDSTSKPTTSLIQDLPIVCRGRAAVDISGEGLNNFYFLSVYSARLILTANIYTLKVFDDKEEGFVSPLAFLRRQSSLGEAFSNLSISDNLDSFDHVGTVNVNNIPLQFDKTDKTVHCPNVETIAPDHLWSLFAHHLLSRAESRLQFFMKITLVLEVDNYNIVPLSLAQVISTCDKFQDEPDFVIKAADGGELQCHKRILAAHSDVLEIVVYGIYNESRNNMMIMGTFDAREVESFLKYLYTGDVTGPNADPDLAIRLLEMGHMYAVEKIEHEMIAFILTKPIHWLKASADGATLIDLCLFAKNMSTDNGHKILTHALDVVLKYRSEVMRCERYIDLFRQFPKIGAELGALLVNRASGSF